MRVLNFTARKLFFWAVELPGGQTDRHTDTITDYFSFFFGNQKILVSLKFCIFFQKFKIQHLHKNFLKLASNDGLPNLIDYNKIF